MKALNISFISLVILCCVFFILYMCYYNKYLNERIKNKCHRKRLIKPYKLFRHMCVYISLTFVVLLCGNIIILNNLSSKYERKIVLCDYISGEEKVVLSYDVLKLEKNEKDNSCKFQVVDDQKFIEYLESFDDYQKNGNEYSVSINGSYYIIEYDSESEFYSLSECTIEVVYDNLGVIDYIPTVYTNVPITFYPERAKTASALSGCGFEYLKEFYKKMNIQKMDIYDDAKKIVIDCPLYQNIYTIKMEDNVLVISLGDDSYTVTFDLQGGVYNEIMDNFQIVYYDFKYDLPTPVKEGSEFLGWYLNLADSYPFNTNIHMYKDFTLYAKWSSNDFEGYNVKYVFNSSNHTDYEFVTYANKITTLEEPSRYGYNFIGWYLDLNDEETLFTSDTIISSNIVLYAKWEEKPKYILTIDAGEGEIYYYGEYVNSAQVELYEGKFGYYTNLPTPVPKSGYQFEGWYIDGNRASILYYITSDVTITANYIPKDFLVTIDACGGEDMDSTYITYGEKIIISTPKREGYEFVGWVYRRVLNNGQYKPEYQGDTMPCYDITAYAVWENYLKDGIDYRLNNDGLSYKVYGLCDKSKTDIVIAEEFLGLPVTSIRSVAFEYNRDLKSVYIPDTVTHIGACSFRGCVNLEQANIPKYIEMIEYEAFSDTSKLNISVHLPKTLTAIGDRVFWGSDIKEVTIEDGLLKIGMGMFAGCSDITKVDIPKSVVEIGKGAFSGCNISELHLNEGLKIIGDNSFKGNKMINELNIPNSVEYIGNGAFSKLNLIKKIILPTSLITLGDEAFSECVNVEEVKFNEGLKSIGAYAFYECKLVKEFNLPNTLETIGDFAFIGCQSLASFSIPENVKQIGITIVDYMKFGQIIDSFYCIDGWIFDVANKTFEGYWIGEKFKGICSLALNSLSNAKAIVIDDTVKSIGSYFLIFSNSKAVIYIESKEEDMNLAEDWNYLTDNENYKVIFEYQFSYPQ